VDTSTSVSITAETDPVTGANQASAAVSGTSEAGDSIDLTVSDGTPAHDVTDSTTANGSGDWSFSGLDLSGLDDGSITYAVDAADSVGNTASDSVGATVDTVAPTASITVHPADPTSSTGASFSFTTNDAAPSSGGITTQCQLDAGGYTSCTSPQAYSSL